MGITKSEMFTDEQNLIASLAKVIGHPARVAILQHLVEKDQCICGDLVLEIGLAQATISQHLKELKNAGLIIGSIEGTKVCYCINSEAFGKVKSLFDGFLNKICNCGPNCCS